MEVAMMYGGGRVVVALQKVAQTRIVLVETNGGKVFEPLSSFIPTHMHIRDECEYEDASRPARRICLFGDHGETARTAGCCMSQSAMTQSAVCLAEAGSRERQARLAYSALAPSLGELLQLQLPRVGMGHEPAVLVLLELHFSSSSLS